VKSPVTIKTQNLPFPKGAGKKKETEGGGPRQSRGTGNGTLPTAAFLSA
jgi:hypothetical protein